METRSEHPIGAWCRANRRSLGWLAREVGVSKRHMMRIVQGHGMQLGTAADIYRVTGVSLMLLAKAQDPRFALPSARFESMAEKYGAPEGTWKASDG